MQFNILALISLAAAASAVSMPGCATPCVTSAMAKSGCGGNIKCLCGKVEYHAEVKSCIQNSCSKKDVETARKIAKQKCPTGQF